MGSFLYGLPLFGTICKVLGHFPVYFLKNEEGKFTTDAAKMAPVEEEVSRHLEAGGVLTLFPEGAMNRADPSKLMTFRYGTFKRALAEDAIIYHFVTCGHEDVWPAASGFSGNPATTGMGLYPVTGPEGTKKYFAELKAKAPKSVETGSSEDFVILAEHARATMQKQYDSLAANTAALSGKNGPKSKRD